MAAGCAARAALFSWRFIIPLIFFIFCYWKIISVLRGNKVGTVNAGNATRSIRVGSRQQHTAGPSTSAAAAAAAAAAAGSRSKPLNKSQKNVIKTMIAVTSCFIACWLPLQFAIVAGMCGLESLQNANLYVALGVIAFVNTSANPFIYDCLSDLRSHAPVGTEQVTSARFFLAHFLAR